ncbi:fimbria/pilus outer membrane usher protein [Aliidiomarina indica]|uniref:fimbria/pilus outer membrane usher protein n=1 Tax=Aliidiomarina indica TaxID=2749147 RepID=UPI00189026C0|nr:fimbria/pilus outer membrane usher protein [Aliidiomarina indica]
MDKRFQYLCQYFKSLAAVISILVFSSSAGYLALGVSEASETPSNTPIQAARLGNWPNKTRLVFEGLDRIDAEVKPGSRSQSIDLRFTFSKPYNNANSWLERIIPNNHDAIQSFQYHPVSSTVFDVRFNFYRPTITNILKLGAMEGFAPRLVIDFYEADFVLEELWLDVTINGQYEYGTVLALTFEGNDVLIDGADLEKWRVNLPAHNYVEHYDAKYYSLRDVGYKFELDRSRLHLSVQIPATEFKELHLKAYQYTAATLTKTEPGFFLNYDLTATRDAVATTGAGYLEFGLFNSLGSLKQTSIHRYDESTSEFESIRLDTVWRTDFPDRMTSFYMGDVLTKSASWNRDLRMAGFKWETNFATQPELIKVPTLAFSGLAGEPSTIDLYINDALRFRREVPPGPFSIDELPTITGYGDVRMVVTDILGRQQVLQHSFFTDRRLLREGLHDYSYSIGAVRENYGFSHADYNGWLINGYHRYGVSDKFTTEWSARLTEHYQLLGLGAVHVLPWSNSFSYSVAASHSEAGAGHLIQLGIQHQRREFNFGIDAQKSFDQFQVSDVELLMNYPQLQVASHISWSPSGFGSFRLGYTKQQYAASSVSFVNAGISTQVGDLGYFSIQALKFLDDHQEYQVSATISIPLGRRSNLSTGATRYANRDTGYVQLQRHAPPGNGIGLRLRHGLLDDSSRRADVLLKSSIGNYTLNYQAHERDGGYEEAYRASVSGSISYVGGYMKLGQPVHDSFGLVSLPEYPNVKVYVDNQHIATTDKDGHAFIPRLRAYQNNRIRLDYADLPLSTNIDSLEQEIRPYYRSGVVIKFPVSQSLNATMSVITTNGDFVPVSAQATNEKSGEITIIGYDGLLYLVGLAAENTIAIEWKKDSMLYQCTLTFKLPNEPDILHDLGRMVCR